MVYVLHRSLCRSPCPAGLTLLPQLPPRLRFSGLPDAGVWLAGRRVRCSRSVREHSLSKWNLELTLRPRSLPSQPPRRRSALRRSTRGRISRVFRAQSSCGRFRELWCVLVGKASRGVDSRVQTGPNFVADAFWVRKISMLPPRRKRSARLQSLRRWSGRAATTWRDAVVLGRGWVSAFARLALVTRTNVEFGMQSLALRQRTCVRRSTA